jgi:uncharacterized protein YjiS (DUF1127 family)
MKPIKEFGRALRAQQRRRRFVKALSQLSAGECVEALAALQFWAKRERRFWWVWDESDPVWRDQ